MSKIYIKQKSRNYYVHTTQDQLPELTGYWERKKGLRSVFKDNNGEKKLEVKIGKCPWIGGPTSYIIDSYELPSVEVKLKSRWKIHFEFNIRSDQYFLYEHTGHKKSLYKNGHQVAKFDKSIFNWGERDSGFAVYNSDENQYLILGLWIMRDMGEWNDADVSADFGNLIPGLVEWNECWNPTK